MTAKEKITKARAGLILDMPFFGSLALRLQVKEDTACETAYTDGKVLGYNPAFIDSLPIEQVKGLLAHEVMHCACSHHTRRGNRDAQKWNIAADYAINQILTDSHVSLPAGALINASFQGMAADQIYSMIPDNKDDTGAETDPGKCGEIRDAKGPDNTQASEADKTQQEQEWKISVQQAAQQAKTQGKLPGGLGRLVEAIVQPSIDWKDVLRRFVDQSAKNDYTWSRPNRRQIAQGLYLPSLYSEELGPIVIGVDTSGSIDNEVLSHFAAEIKGILEDYKTSATIIYCDSQINRIDTYTSEDFPKTLETCGGGGTDFNPVFSHVEENNLIPACLIYLTDMEGYFPKHEPEYPVLWAKYGNSRVQAPIGETVQIR